MIYICTDGNQEIEIEADSAQEAAQEYVDGGDYLGNDLKTTWVNVYVCESREYSNTVIKITVDPEEPKCTEDKHDWQNPIEIVGGCRENPGVFGSGGGVMIIEVCMHCGCGKHNNTWDYDPQDGKKTESIEYIPGEFRQELEELQNNEEDN